MENKRNLNCKKGMETKITHFCLQTRGLIRVWEEEIEEEEEGGGAKQRYGSYEFLYGILKFCVNVHAIVWLGACPKPRVC